MSYKTILAHFTNEKRATELLKVAVMLARKNGAHLIGLFVIPEVWINPAVAMEVPVEILASRKKIYREEAARIEALFNKATSAEGLSAEWRIAQSPTPSIANIVIEQGQEADLIVIGQADSATDDDYSGEVPRMVLMECGRPVLIVPHKGSFKSVGEFVAVGWNGTREASRATFDALPFLESAKEVQLHCVNPEKQEGKNGQLVGAELAATLARHGVNVTVENISESKRAVGDELLSYAGQKGADLLVMGGYGHSRSREFIFGGATKYILEHMTIPVLMSH